MYLTQVEVRKSSIDGEGVFTLKPIQKGEIVWKFNPNHDKAITRKEFDSADEFTKTELKRVAYLSKSTNRWIFSTENDPARYTNHSKDSNLSVFMDEYISVEPVFVANRDIATGEELTNNYIKFDKYSLNNEEGWLK